MNLTRKHYLCSMKNRTLLIIVFCIMSMFFMACNHKVAKNSFPEKGYKQHEVIFKGKRITFMLPEDYVSSEECNIKARRASSGCYYDTLTGFWSVKDSINNFGIVTAMSDYKESEIDTSIKNEFNFWKAQGAVPFIEKKYDENKHVYYITMVSMIEQIPTEEPYIFSKFVYFTIFQDRYFRCELNMIEPVNHNFSYEEKRKIIESIKIEDI